jgi:aminopeptidase-like protein
MIIRFFNPHSEEIPALGELKFGLDDGQFNMSGMACNLGLAVQSVFGRFRPFI